MLRVGLTGGLGSGKSTVARMFNARGAVVLSSDEMGRELMQPGERVYAAIVEYFGDGVVAADGSLDRAELARIAFGAGREGEGRVEELNAIVHPEVIARQEELIGEIAGREREQRAGTVVVVESALLFSTTHGGEGGWRRRFDKIVFVKAAEELRVERFVLRAARGEALRAEEREALEAEARRRLAKQEDGEREAAMSDYVLVNDGTLEELEAQVEAVWQELVIAAGGGA